MSSGKIVKLKMGDNTLFRVINLISEYEGTFKIKIQSGNEVGYFYFDSGYLVHGEAKSIQGKEACYELVAWRDGIIEFEQDVKIPLRTVNIHWPEMLFHYVLKLKEVIDPFIKEIPNIIIFEITDEDDRIVYSFSKERKQKFADFEKIILKDKPIKDLERQAKKSQEQEVLFYGAGYQLLIRFLKEVCYFVKVIFPEKAFIDLPRHWLRSELEKKILDAFSFTLKKCDKMNVNEISTGGGHVTKGLLRKRIVAADDEKYIRELISIKLTSLGYEVITVENGQKAVEAVKTYTPDLVLLDVVMPVLDGFSALKEIRKNPKFQKTPIIMLTAQKTEEEKQKGYSLGASEYLIKPFSPTQLAEKISKFLEAK